MRSIASIIWLRSGVAPGLFLAVLSLFATASFDGAFAHEYQLGQLKIEHPWTRATPNGAQTAGGFFRIKNNGTAADRLIGASLVASAKVELHETRAEGDVMRMRLLDKGVTIPPGQTVEFRPGSYHAMFLQLAQPFKEGERIKGTLIFETAGTVDVEFKVEALGKATAGQHH